MTREEFTPAKFGPPAVRQFQKTTSQLIAHLVISNFFVHAGDHSPPQRRSHQVERDPFLLSASYTSAILLLI
jgi:hypothetical protein